MPFQGEHTARLIRPELFEEESFRRKTMEPGIDLIFGQLKGKDKLSPQSYRFNSDRFTVAQAKKWLEDNEFKYILFEPALEKKKMEAFQKRVVLAELRAFKDFDIMSHIDPDILAKIKERDPHPFFKAYAIAHEGTSTPRVIGEGAQKIDWPRKAIQSIKGAIKKGIKFFSGHNEDNSIEGRPYLGRIVGSAEIEIDGKLHSVAIGYFNPKHRNEVKNYDVCSMEAVWNLVKQGGRVVGDTIHKLTGIALANGQEEAPAWSGAKELAMVQAFEAKEKEVVEMPEEIKFNDVQSWIKDHVVHPSQLFTLDEIKKDHKFIDQFKVWDDNMIRLEEANKQLDETKKENETIKIESQKATVQDRLNKLGVDQKWTDTQKKYILNRVDQLAQYNDEALGTFVETQKALFSKDAKIFGVDTAVSVKDENASSGIDSKDYTKAENNELLDSDYEEI